MEKELIDFINENEQLINENRWEELYQKCDQLKRGALTDCLLAANLEVFEKMDKIPNGAFFLSKIIEFTIPNNITSISKYAFNTCPSLTSIVIPDSVSSIDYAAFSYCVSLTSVAIPNSVTTIGNCAFYGCESLTSVIIPNTVTSIGEGAFQSCTKLTSVIIGDGVTSIGVSAFYGCTSLTDITIPNSLTTIGKYAFDGCHDINITYEGTKERWKNIAKGKFNGVTYTCNCLDGIFKKSR